MDNQKTLQQAYNEEVERIMRDCNVSRFKAKRILKNKLIKGDI